MYVSERFGDTIESKKQKEQKDDHDNKSDKKVNRSPASLPAPDIYSEKHLIGLNLDEQEWVKMGQKSMKALLRELESNEGDWQEKQAEGSTRVLGGNIPGVSYKAFKGMGMIQASPTRLFNLIYDAKLTSDWDSNKKVYKVVNVLGPHFDVVYVQTNKIGPISSRDQCKVRVWKRYKGGFAVASCSVNAKDYKPISGVVRAATAPGDGLILLPVAGRPGVTAMTNLMVSDIKGWVPRSVVDMTVGGAILKFYKETLPKTLKKYQSSITEESARDYINHLLNRKHDIRHVQ